AWITDGQVYFTIILFNIIETDSVSNILMQVYPFWQMTYNGKSIPLPFNMDIFKWSEETRQIIDTAHLPDGVKFYNIFGTTYETPFSVCYGTETSPIGDLQEICNSK
ncbi:hypothetical protein KI387_013339, partial [Taxus chinensis]